VRLEKNRSKLEPWWQSKQKLESEISPSSKQFASAGFVFTKCFCKMLFRKMFLQNVSAKFRAADKIFCGEGKKLPTLL
jgi:hypothetical protein